MAGIFIRNRTMTAICGLAVAFAPLTGFCCAGRVPAIGATGKVDGEDIR